MKNLFALVCALVASMSSIAQCPTIYSVSGGGSYCGGSLPVLTQTNTDTGTTYWLFSTRYNTIGAVIPGTGAGYTMSLPGTSDSWKVLARRGTCTDTMSGTVTVVSGIPSALPARNVCVGDSITIIDSASGGIWTSSNPSVASIDIIAGTDSMRARVWGITTGTAAITYLVTGACGTNSVTTNVTVGVTSAPATITGPDTLCLYAGTPFTSSIAGGTWTIATAGIATVTASGLAYGLSAGRTTLSYTYISSCGSPVVSARTVVVSPIMPTSAPITGPMAVAIGAPVGLTFTGSISGTWTTMFGSVDSVSSSGVVTGLSLGYDYITYDYDSAFCHLQSIHPIEVVPAGSHVRSSLYSTVASTCSGAAFTIAQAIYDTSVRVVTAYGDGSQDTTRFFRWGSQGRDTLLHNYVMPGTYSIRHLVVRGSTRIDSLVYSWFQGNCREIAIYPYWDADSNCAFTSGDYYNGSPLTFEVDSNGVAVDTISATSGFFYRAYGGAGDVYRFRVLSGLCSMTCSPGYLIDTITGAGFTISIKHMPLKWIGHGSFDIVTTVTGESGRHAQTGAISTYTLGDSISAVATLHFNSRYSIYGAWPSVTASSSGVATWNLGRLRPGDIPAQINYHLEVLGGSGFWFTPGDTVGSTLRIDPMTRDADSSNNVVSRLDTVRASFDPNYVEVHPAGGILNGTKLHYVIHFENDGNDTAINIHVLDTLPDNVDVSTLRIETASAAMTVSYLRMGGHNVVKFDFPNIMLPDSSHHGLCTGFVAFNIKARSGLADGTVIPDRAGIYFDDNPVVLTNTISNIIVVPSVSISSTGGDTICHGAPKHFTATPHSVNTPRFQWYINTTPAGTDSIGFTTSSLVTGDIVKCRMTTIMDDTILNYSNNVTIIERRLDAGSITGPAPTCVGATSCYTTSGATDTGGTWSILPARATYVSRHDSTACFVFSSTGTSTLFYRISNVCGADTAAFSISSINIPYAGTIAGPTSVCPGSTITLTDSVAGGTWRVANSRATISSSGVVRGVSAGLDTVLYITSNFCGSDTASSTITVNSLTYVADTISVNHNPVCAGDTVTFTVVPTNGGSSPFLQWKRFGMNMDTGTTFTYVPAVGDIITCDMTSSALCPSPLIATSNSITMIVNPLVTPTIGIIASPGDSVTITGQLITFFSTVTYGGSPTLYQWFKNGIAVSGATSSSYSTNVFSNDTVYCSITSNIPCASATSATSNVVVIYADYLAVGDLHSAFGSVVLYPNPNTGSFVLQGQLLNGERKLVVRVTDVVGRVLYERSFMSQANKFREEIALDESIAPGVYFLKIGAGRESKVLRFTKE